MVEDIKCLTPLGKSYHIGLSFKLVTSAIMKNDEHEANGLNHHNADYKKMNLLFKRTQYIYIIVL